MPFTADAIEHSQVAEGGGELQITTPREHSLALKAEDVQKVLRQMGGKPLRVKILIGEVAAGDTAPLESKAKQENELAERALSNPEVRRFREVFGGEVRAIRNLKE